MIAWLIFACIATAVVWEYGTRTIVVTIAFLGTVFGILVSYRIGRYWDAVRDMEIISFKKWQQLKDQGAI